MPFSPYHIYGEDIRVSASGDILLVYGDELSMQYVWRRILTNKGDDINHLNYGMSARLHVGTIMDKDELEGDVLTQMLYERMVDQNPPPIVTTQVNTNNTAIVTIIYTNADSGSLISVQVPVKD